MTNLQPSGYSRYDSPFVRSGRVLLTIEAGTFGYAGDSGNWWSLRSSGTDNAYNLNLHPKGITSSLIRTYNFSYSLRCLSTVLDI